MTAGLGEVVRLAQNLGRNCGYAVFPCGQDKRPTLRGWPDRAATVREAIEQLWCDQPGPLIGIVCGERSGISVLDLDAKHDEARAWHAENRERLPPTRIYRSRAGGAHLMFAHTVGVKNTASKIAHGVDTRGDGGYVISWFAAGLPCLDHTPPAPWPAWLLRLILPPPPRPPERRLHAAPRNVHAAIASILQSVSSAPEGQRNGRLNWAAYRLGTRVVARELGRGEAEGLLTEAAKVAGLPKAEASATIASGLRGAGA